MHFPQKWLSLLVVSIFLLPACNQKKHQTLFTQLPASVTGITALLSKDFIRLVIISFLFAAPLSYWAMHNWLQDYTYRITIQWWVFAAACLLSVAIAVLTVSFQAMKAARANPVKSLRTE